MSGRGTPSVRLVEGSGIALRVAGLVVWFARPEGADLEELVQGLVVAAQKTPGQVPVDHLATLAGEIPGLSLAAVAVGTDFGRAWVCGGARVTLAGVAEREIAATGAAPDSTYFPLPRSGLRLGGTAEAAGWSHLVEGAVPAAGIEVVWKPAAVVPGVDSSSPAPGPTSAAESGKASGAGSPSRRTPGFESVSLVNVQAPLAAAPLPVGSGATVDDAVVVAGLRCAQGHFNHPHAAHCAWCGIGMAQVSHVLVREPRPAVGVLILDAQATFTLDADYVLGRDPRVRSEVDGIRVRELVLGPDRSISRAHVAIRLRDWDVLVEDLTSAMGTWVQQPGQGPFQIPPGQPLALAPGGVVFVGPHRLTFHSHFLT
ncbi:FHA domain-containing protein [Ammonicoccus fulvus]|uniref:FHA domain-containing protein n=1 Tax=Ammonicoccus fulvus TaxID=3138240 RepID=A0ABZ3FL44_9ACTN